MVTTLTLVIGAMYKIVTKVLACKLQPRLFKIIRPNQTGFMEGRDIIDDIYLRQMRLDGQKKATKILLSYSGRFRKNV